MTFTFTEEDISLAVQRGTLWLDENHPGWESRINLEKLLMNNCSNCVIGQAVGDFYDTILAAAVVDDAADADIWAEYNGFKAPDCYTTENGYDHKAESYYYRRLEVLWTDEVTERLG